MENETAKILVVDDLEDNRDMLERRLSNKGCDVTTASSGHEALQKIRENKPEIVLLDIMMPDLNGFDVIDRVRHDKQGHQPAIMAISARHDTEAVLCALNRGADDYVTKPYDFSVVWARIERLLRRTRSATLAREVNTRLVNRLQKMQQGQ